jgi:hypothetical protein
MNAKENWNFTVVGCDSQDIPKYLGFTQTREEAETFKRNMEAVGWHRIAIFDAAHQEQIDTLQKELATKTRQLEQAEDFLRRQQGQGYGRG